MFQTSSSSVLGCIVYLFIHPVSTFMRGLVTGARRGKENVEHIHFHLLVLSLGSPILGRATATARGANYCGPVTVHSPRRDGPPQRGLLITSGVRVLSKFICARVVRRVLRFIVLFRED